jgi:hypothetical protein
MLGTDGEPGVLVPDAKWPVFFTTGERPLGLPPVSGFTADYKYGNFPLTARFIDLSTNNPVTWHWTFEGGNPSESGEQYPKVIFENPGFYRITLITSNNFGSDTLVRERYIHSIDPVAAESEESISFIAWPNPVSDVLNLSIDKERFKVKVLDGNGKTALQAEDKRSIDMSDLSPGLYILEIQNENSVYRIKLVKQ